MDRSVVDDEGPGKNLIKTDPVEETDMCPSMKRGNILNN